MPLQSNPSTCARVRVVSATRPWTGCYLFAVALLMALQLPQCTASQKRKEDQPNADTPTPSQLPRLAINDDTADLLLTWIDDRGDFHVSLKPSEVPEESRQKVRVVVTTAEEGTGKLVYVADLREKGSDGNYKVATFTRAQWDELGAARRSVRLEALAPKAETAPAPSATSSESGAASVSAVIYGADWCKPCHLAEKMLKDLGVDVTMKNIEKSPSARAEMQLRLSKDGRVGASIPVIVVAGQLFVGYSAGQLKQAVNRARKPETL